MNINLEIPVWWACPITVSRQFLLRDWQKVQTTGKTDRGTGYRVGETHHNAKLSDHDVEMIRQLHEYGMSCIKIAKKYETTPQNISGIVNYRFRVGIGMGQNLVFE